MSLWAELKRRNVIRIAAAYVVFGYILLQGADIVLGFTGAPDWVGKALIALLLLGFVPTLVLAWVFEVGPDGIHRDDGTRARDQGPQARRLDVVTLIAVAVLMGLLAWQQLGSPPSQETTATASPREVVRAAPTVEPLRAPEGTIAVLPFTNRSAEADTAYFVDGIHDDLLTELSRNGRLTVISRTSVMEYRDTTKNLRQIGEELGVAHVLEGAVQRAGQRVRINAQLIDAATDAHLWAETFDRELTPENIFEIQTEIATAIAQALGRALAGGADATTPRAPTQDARAYDLYLRARAGRMVWTEDDIRRRIAIYEEVLERDPQFAWAIAELGREHLNLFWFITRRDADRDRARALLDQALAIAPDDPQIQLAMAEYHYRAHLDYDAALAALARVETHLPGSSELMSLRAFVLRRKGDVAGTLAALQAAARLDPRSLEVIRALVEMHWLLGNFEQMDRWHEHLVVLPDLGHWGRNIPGYARLQRLGDPQQYMAGRMNLDELATRDPSGDRGQVFWASYWLRDFERAEAELAAVDQLVFADQFDLVPRPLMQAYLARARGQATAVREYARAARVVLDDVLDEHPDDYRAWAALGEVRALLGDARGAAEAIARSQAHPLVQRDVMLQSEVHRSQLVTLAMTAESPAVAAEMDRFLQREMNYWGYDGLMLDPVFDAHREHPAFQALAARYSQR